MKAKLATEKNPLYEAIAFTFGVEQIRDLLPDDVYTHHEIVQDQSGRYWDISLQITAQHFKAPRGETH